MEQPITTILMAPSGTGKSTRIQALQKNGLQFVHIDRDRITATLWYERFKGFPPPDMRENGELINWILVEGKRRYFNLVEQELTKATPHIIIDYPPDRPSNNWTADTINMSINAGRKIVVEGIAADPIVTL